MASVANQRERMPVRVLETRDATADIRIFICEQLERDQHTVAAPGAHIDVHIDSEMTRQYSLLSSDSGRYAFAVKKEVGGRGGSVRIFNEIRAGDVIYISGPRNHFKLESAGQHSVLIGGGIGITPIYSMFRQLSRTPGASWELHYAARTRADSLFLEEFGRHPQFNLHLDLPSGAPSLDLPEVISRAPAGSHFYCCGPAPMMGAFKAATRSIAPEFVHVEHFGAVEGPVTGAPFKIKLKKSGLVLDVPGDKSILEVLLEHGIEVQFSCREGTCGACEVDIVEGVPEHHDTVLSAKEKQAGKSLMVCRSRCKSAMLVLDL